MKIFVACSLREFLASGPLVSSRGKLQIENKNYITLKVCIVSLGELWQNLLISFFHDLTRVYL